ncbi:DUF4129 domain-containing protein [Fulvimarina sp. MAC8]
MTQCMHRAGRARSWSVRGNGISSATLALAILTGFVSPAFAQSDSNGGQASLAPYAPPSTEASTNYQDAVRGRGLQVGIDYLHPDSELDADLSNYQPEDASIPQTPRDFSDPVRLIAIAILIGFILFLGIYAWSRRGGLLDRAGPKPHDRNRPDRGRESFEDNRDIDTDFIARLRSETDPRVGLRQVLQRFLALAARDNEIVLKRSLTTRELLERLPGSWHHRSALQTVARRVELVVFGGRTISREDYEECLDLAAPFLKRTGQ